MFDFKDIRKVDIIVFEESGLEANAIRSMLESFNILVRVHYIGNILHFISLLQTPNYLAEIIIISCHGDNNGILLPKLATEIEEKMPYSKILRPEGLNFLHLNKQLIINTGCCLGKAAFAEAFIKNGAHAYIGAIDYVEGNVCSLFVVTILYFYLIKNFDLSLAYEQAKNIDNETNLFKLWIS